MTEVNDGLKFQDNVVETGFGTSLHWSDNWTLLLRLTFLGEELAKFDLRCLTNLLTNTVPSRPSPFCRQPNVSKPSSKICNPGSPARNEIQNRTITTAAAAAAAAVFSAATAYYCFYQ